jgi:hypothetical protein
METRAGDQRQDSRRHDHPLEKPQKVIFDIAIYGATTLPGGCTFFV